VWRQSVGGIDGSGGGGEKIPEGTASPYFPRLCISSSYGIAQASGKWARLAYCLDVTTALISLLIGSSWAEHADWAAGVKTKNW